jgi:hypothetical protein
LNANGTITARRPWLDGVVGRQAGLRVGIFVATFSINVRPRVVKVPGRMRHSMAKLDRPTATNPVRTTNLSWTVSSGSLPRPHRREDSFRHAGTVGGHLHLTVTATIAGERRYVRLKLRDDLPHGRSIGITPEVRV